jgi:hypothetical protein
MLLTQFLLNLSLRTGFGGLKLAHLPLKFPLLTRHVPLFFADRELLADFVPPQPV